MKLFIFLQILTYGGAGVVGKHFSGELGFGYRVKKTSFTVGYVSPPAADQPVYFNARISRQLGPVVPYIGIARKKLDIGANASISKYQNGDIYVGAGYMGILYAHIGLSWNLFCND